LEIFDGEKEVVAVTSYHRSFTDRRASSNWRRLRSSPFCLHLVLMKKEKLTREKELETILVLCVFLVILFFVNKAHHKYFLTLSVVLGLVGIFSKYLTSKIAWAWMKLSEMMGVVMNKVILGIVFFIFLFPIALLSRVFSKKDSLQLKKTDGPSYYFERNYKFEAKDLENTW
jgi:hypothetical protein